MFGIKKLKQKIKDIETALQYRRDTESYANSMRENAMKDMFSKIQKPKYKVGQKVWAYKNNFLHYGGFIQAVVCGHSVVIKNQIEYEYYLSSIAKNEMFYSFESGISLKEPKYCK